MTLANETRVLAVAGLSPKRLNVLRSLARFAVENRRPPTFKELAKAAGVRGLATVYKHVHALEDSGYIEPLQFQSVRKLQLTEKGQMALGPLACPKCGHELTGAN